MKSLIPASFIIISISYYVNPEEASILIFCFLLVPLLLVLTWRIPLASISKATSICGTPPEGGEMPFRWKPYMAVPTLELDLSLPRICIFIHSWLPTESKNFPITSKENLCLIRSTIHSLLWHIAWYLATQCKLELWILFTEAIMTILKSHTARKGFTIVVFSFSQ